MAEMNILNGTYHGRLGRTTGVKWKNKEVVKGKIWSKTPNNETQTKSVRAFECLNRIASAIAKNWWQWLGLSDSKMLKHNAVARLLKDCVTGHTFTPAGFFPCFHKDGTNALLSHTWDNETKMLSFKAQTYLSGTLGRDFSWMVLVFDLKGKVYYVSVPPTKTVEISIYIPYENENEPFILLLNSVKDGKKYRLGGLVLNDFVVLETLYTELLRNSEWFYIADGEIAGTNYDSVTVDSETETIYITG